MTAREEIFVPFPSPTQALRHMRGTVLLGSIQAVRESPRWDEYVKFLETQYHEPLLTTVAASWVPLEIAAAHYRACDKLGLSVEEQVNNGRKTFARASGVIFGTVTKMAKEVGVTPWTLMAQFPRFWARSYDGGGVQVRKVGPKEAYVDVIRAPLFGSRYHRNAVRGVIVSSIDLFCSKGYMTERLGAGVQDGVAYRVQWA